MASLGVIRSAPCITFRNKDTWFPIVGTGSTQHIPASNGLGPKGLLLWSGRAGGVFPAKGESSVVVASVAFWNSVDPTRGGVRKRPVNCQKARQSAKQGTSDLGEVGLQEHRVNEMMRCCSPSCAGPFESSQGFYSGGAPTFVNVERERPKNMWV